MSIVRASVTPLLLMSFNEAVQPVHGIHASYEVTIDELAKQALAAFDAIAGVL